ncbi:uncharacterized protein BDR25DRAFT_230701 [Lindgomyces ingoldianus]|uniref:Uncharacterized protein n=1 Tax=Lindgomyces ingoldianus TaxID=673940 RepID=A0ACB6QPV8_9PLEO|nr:uncharacterized protein BDR25DRAFT_230701 [Lindgomyces ingoldianus]KAF2468915.1 hypothetical protein BDR25DRAFT_230701 [Lindgomyces ingoldianus]
MRKFFSRKLHRKAVKRPGKNHPRTRVTFVESIPHGPVQPQNQSSFFDKLSTELRILIYAAFLGHPVRPMHIVPFDDGSGRLGPIKILYTANEFSFKGAKGVLALRAVVPTSHWHTIRHVHVSTMFLTPKDYWSKHENYPPENFANWTESCNALQDLRDLRTLRIDIVVYDSFDREHPGAVDDASLVSILQPLKDIKAQVLEVELNFPIPDTVRRALSKINFTISTKKRPYNTELFWV